MFSQFAPNPSEHLYKNEPESKTPSTNDGGEPPTAKYIGVLSPVVGSRDTHASMLCTCGIPDPDPGTGKCSKLKPKELLVPERKNGNNILIL